MEVVFKSKNMELTDALKDHARQKVTKVEHLGLTFEELEVKLIVEKNPSIKDNQIAELTVSGNGMLFRATDRDRDMYVAIDKAVGKLARQIKKYHGKQIDRTQHQPSTRVGPPSEEQEVEGPDIVKTKSISLKPMTPEEAALQMEMLGHDFYVFTDSETGNACVIYRRRDGNYGLIDTSI
jgi:putative sigma-54 modulation protein